MRRLVVVFDVSEFTDEEVENLRFAAMVEGEADAGEFPHPDASASSHVVTDAVRLAAIDREVARYLEREGS